MKTLSEFLAEHIIIREDFVHPKTDDEADFKDMLEYMISQLHEGIEAYKEHLQKDRPKTVQWAMIERGLIAALNRMEAKSHEEVRTPICPLYMYFEGDEEVCDSKKCDFELARRSCTRTCEKNNTGRPTVARDLPN